MDWNEVPEGEGGKADIAVWHDIIDEKVSSLLELPAEIPGGEIPKVVMVTEDAWSALDSYELTEYTQAVRCPNYPEITQVPLISNTEPRSRHQCPNLRSSPPPPSLTNRPSHTPRLSHRNIPPHHNPSRPPLQRLLGHYHRQWPKSPLQCRLPSPIRLPHHNNRQHRDTLPPSQKRRADPIYQPLGHLHQMAQNPCLGSRHHAQSTNHFLSTAPNLHLHLPR